MPGRIEGSEDVRAIFDVFHDGSITRATPAGDDLIFDVDIEYLAERVDPAYRKFFVRLAKVRGMRFETWPRDGSEPAMLTDLSAIFQAELEILSAHHTDGAIEVVCEQHSRDFDYQGGSLHFQADSALVTDQAGQEYSMDELDALCRGYWDDWAEENRRNKG